MSTILTLSNDETAVCPSDCGDGEWKLYTFRRDDTGHVPRERFLPPGPGLRSKLRAGLAFVLDYFEHGRGIWSIHGTGPQCQWDNSPGAGVLVWEHRPRDMGAKTLADRMKDAQSFLERYTNWMNGDVYRFDLTEVDGTDIEAGNGFDDPETMAEEVRALVADDDVEIRGEAAWLARYYDFKTKRAA